MPLPRHSKSKNAGRLSRPATAPSAKGWLGLRLKDLTGISNKLREKFHWTHTPREFQLEAIKAQLLRKDVLVHAGTGSGKTTIAAGPHAFIDPSKGMVTFMVSPLIALQEEQVATFRNEFGLKAVAVNSVGGGCTKETMTKICAGEWQIILVSPEIILSPAFISNVFQNAAIRPRILSVIVDEAHVVSHWGANFRKDYGRIGMLRAQLPEGTPFVAMSATLSLRIRRDILKKLQFNEKEYISLDIGNDRTNVSLVVRAMHNPMNAYSDLDFVIPSNVTNVNDIPKTMIYCDQINAEVGIEARLDERLPKELQKTGLVRPYNAAFTPEHRTLVMSLFKEGVVRVLVCTDAAGMGCNVLDVDVVVQWKLPATVSTFVQRAGRAARDPTRTGLAVLLVEKSVYDADLSKLLDAIVRSSSKAKGIRQSSTYPKGPKGYAIRHGVQRGSCNGLSDEKLVAGSVPLDSNSLDEGLYTLAQTGICRREILTAIYSNKPPHPTAPCCDLCDPTLLDRTRPGSIESVPRNTAVKTGMLDGRVKRALEQWRTKIYTRDFDGAMFGPSAILAQEKIDTLSSMGAIETRVQLQAAVGRDWPWMEAYGNELLEELAKLEIGPMQRNRPKARVNARVEKRPAGEDKNESEGEPTTKKTRTTLPVDVRGFPVRIENPTAVIPGPSTSHPPRPVLPHYASMPSMSSGPVPYGSSTPLHHNLASYYLPTPVPYNPYQHMLQHTYYMPHPGHAYYQTPTRLPESSMGTSSSATPSNGAQLGGSNSQNRQ